MIPAHCLPSGTSLGGDERRRAPGAMLVHAAPHHCCQSCGRWSADVASRHNTEGTAMAKRKAARKVRTSEIDRSLEALERGLRGLGEVSEDLAKVRENLRKYLDEAEESLGQYPRLLQPRRLARTRRR